MIANKRHSRSKMSIFILSLILLSVGSVFCPSLKIAPLSAAESVAVSYQGPGVFNLPVELAAQRGFFQDQNLDVKLILTRPDVDRPALITGDIDFTLRGSSTVLSAARGLPVRMLFVGTVKPFWALVVRPEVNSVKELKGKVLGVAGIAGGHHVATRLILKEYGLDPDKDAVYKIIPAGSRIPALRQARWMSGSWNTPRLTAQEKAAIKSCSTPQTTMRSSIGASGSTSRSCATSRTRSSAFSEEI